MDHLSSRADAISRRRVLAGGISLVGLGALSACGASNAGTHTSSTGPATPKIHPKVDGNLTWLTWSGYVPPKVVTAFEAKYGVTVTQSYFSNPMEYIQKLGAGEPFDLITTNSAYHPIEISQGLIQTFDWSDLKYVDNVLPWFQHPFYDDGKYRYTIPYGIGPTGFTYRADKVANISGEWNDFWSHPEASGHIYLLNEEDEVMSMSLLHSNYPMNTANPTAMTKAMQSVLTLKPDLAGFSSDTQTLMPAGRLWMAQTWPTAFAAGVKSSKDASVWHFVLPRDGAPVAADSLSVGANAKSPGTALLFMDWMLRPDNAAALAVYDFQHTGTKSGSAAYLAAAKSIPDLDFPVSRLVENRGLWKLAPIGPRATLMNSAWNQILA